jgi:hypothetical protein
MQTANEFRDDEAHTASIGEVKDSASRLLQSELKLAAAELKRATGQVKNQSVAFLAATGVALLGLLPMMSFLVISLGMALGDRYWLSSLILFVLFTGIGAAVAYRSLKNMRVGDLSLPRTRMSLVNTGETVKRAAQEVTLTTRERVRETTRSPF